MIDLSIFATKLTHKIAPDKLRFVEKFSSIFFFKRKVELEPYFNVYEDLLFKV